MKQTRFWLTTIAALLCSLTANAYDFEVGGIYYTITSSSDLSVEVVPGTSKYSGVVSIPSTIPYNNKVYRVTSIGNSAFRDCTSLTAITFSEGVISVGTYAFYDCSSLTTITIPKNSQLVSIGSSAFSGCSSLATITIPKNSQLVSIGSSAFSGCSSLASINIPESVTSIGSSAFNGCKSLAAITIPKRVTSIGSSAFRGCYSLTSVNFHENSQLTTIKNYVFYSCGRLTNINIPESVTSIGDQTFRGCTSLISITIPKNVTSIGDYAFVECSGLYKVINYSNLAISRGSTDYGRVAYYAKKVVNVNELNTFGDYQFHTSNGIHYLTNYIGDDLNLILPDSYNGENYRIDDYAFYDCSNLISLTIPESVTGIGDCAFESCIRLYKVINYSDLAISQGSTDYGKVTYYASKVLDSIDLKTIGDYQFHTSNGIHYLTNYIGDDLNLILPDSYNGENYRIDDYAFCGCSNLISFAIPESVTGIGGSAFLECHNLSSIAVPENVTSIGDFAFYGCANLKNITIGASVSTIGAYAFGNVYGIENIYVLNTNAITCNESVFATDVYNNAILYVPTGREFAYEKTEPWSNFHIEPMKKFTITYIIDGSVYEVQEVEYASEIELPIPIKEGHTFSGWSEAPETMPANDVTISGTFTVNKYLVTFKIGDDVIAADSLEYGETIVTPEAPEKEGHSFNGWGEVAETVPANDLTYEGSYSVNSYLLSYTVDGETVQSDTVAYGTAIGLLDEPVKEGHTFSGWSEAPETMPANDVIVSGTFTINKYLVTFKIGDEVIATDSLEYGAAIVVPEAPEREGHTFNGWGEVVEIVPASDLTYEGTYTVNIYKVYYYVGEELIHTVEVTYGETIPEYVYEPTEEGYTFLGWIGETYETMPAHDVTYMANIDNGIDLLTINKSQLTIYDLSGRKIEVGDLRELREGIYFINGRKVLIK